MIITLQTPAVLVDVHPTSSIVLSLDCGASPTVSLSVNEIETDFTLGGGPGFWTVTATPTLQFNGTYSVRIQAISGVDTTVDAFEFATETGIVIPDRQFTRPPLVQLLANYLPEQYRARKDEYSIWQLLVASVDNLDNMRQQLSRQFTHCFPQIADLNQPAWLFRYSLPANVDFKRRPLQNGEFDYITPTIIGLDGVNLVDVEIAERNQFNELWWFSIPTRITESENYTLNNTIVARTALADVETTAISDLTIEGKVWLVVDSGEVFVASGVDDVTPRRILTISISGKDLFKQDIIEEIPFIINEAVETNQEWSEITEVKVFGKDFADGFLAIYNTKPQGIKLSDHLFIVGLPDGREGGSYWSFDDDILTQEILAGIPSDTVAQITDMTAICFSPLIDSDGLSVTPDDILVEQYADWVYCVQGPRLLIYDKRKVIHEYAQEVISDSFPGVQLDIEYLDSVPKLGNKVEFHAVLKRPTDRPVALRFSVKFPSGTTYYITAAGALTLSDNTWIDNPLSSLAQMDTITVEFTPTLPGGYLVGLDVRYTSGIRSTKRVLDLQAKSPLAEYDLTHILPLAASDCRLFFTPDRKVGVQYQNTAYILDLHFDYMLIDFTNKNIYFREHYDKIKVTI